MKKATILYSLLLLLLFSCSTKEGSKKNRKISSKTQENKVDKNSQKTPETVFTYIPIKPVDGKLKAVVELGASSFNSFIIELDKEKNWELKKKEFGSSSILEGATDIKKVSEKLKEYIQKIIAFGVSSKEIHFVVSSGADKEKVTKKIKEELQKIGYKVNVVTAEEEGKYALKAVLPIGFEETSFTVDIGSGNTKISYVENNKIISKETFGAKYFKKGINSDEVYKDVKKFASLVPKEKRNQIFIVGGVPYQMAKSLRKEKERFTVLNKDISVYDKLVSDKGEKIKCGLNIYKAINDTTNPNTVVFDWDANFTIGFLLSLDY